MRLGEYTARSEIQIDRPIEDVWAFVADPGNDPHWCPLVADVTPIDRRVAGQPRYTFVQRFGPTHHIGAGEVVSASPHTDLHGKAQVMGGTFHYVYRLEPVAGGTRFIHENEVRWSGLMRLLHPVQQRMTKRIMDRQMRTLKEILEKESE